MARPAPAAVRAAEAALSGPQETFDPQAVRELLELVESSTNASTRTSSVEYAVPAEMFGQILQAAQRVRESEK